MQPDAFKSDSRHFKSRIVLGVIGIILGSCAGAVWAVNHLLLRGL